MRYLPRFLCGLFASVLSLSAVAQTPKVYLKFNGDLTDASGANIITSVVPTGFTPTYTTDRLGQANGALILNGSASLQLVAAALSGNSNQAVGIRNAGGTNTSFTLSAWVYVNSVSSQGFNTVFGNLGSGSGTLHAGVGTNTDKAHFGFDVNDVNGATAGLSAGVWYHLAFVNDANSTTPSQRIFINGVPEITRYGAAAALRATDLYIGNWGTATDANNDFKGRLDEVAVFDSALRPDQVQALFNGVAPTSLATTGLYSASKLPGGVYGTAGNWGIREIKNYPGIAYGTLVNADRIARTYATSPGGTVVTYQAPVINFVDDEGPGNAGYFTNDGDYGSNTPADDNSILMIARCAVRIAVEDDYTFGFRGDDGSRLRVVGQQFKSSTRIYTGNVADPAHNGDGIYCPNGTGDSNTIGIVHLTPGDYNLELTYWEGSGGSSIEVFAARGAKTTVDSAFQLVGNPAAGGLEIVPDPDLIPTFTANGGTTTFIHSGNPATFTLAWAVKDSGTVLSIDQGIGTVAQSGNLVLNAPTQTTTYTITATTGTVVNKKSVTVYVDAPPVVTMTADDTTVTSGANVKLSWTSDGATTLTLQPGNINVTGLTSRTVNPTSTTTYTLVGTNPAGSTQSQVVVTVGTAPTINSFVAADNNLLFGGSTGLSWTVTNADSVAIDNGVGPISGSTGTVSVSPQQSTTYTLTATNQFASATRTALVSVPTPIGVTSEGYSVRRINSSVAFPYASQSYLQSADSLVAGQNKSSETTQSGYTTVNFTDGIDGDFTASNSVFPGGSGDNFVCRITATLIVNTPGEYRFEVNSDDGARLRIDGQDVIVDDGTHSPSATTGTVVLTKPNSQLELVYYDVTGSGEVELGWIRPDGKWQLLTTTTPSSTVVRGKVVISEFMAENKNTLLDEDGQSSDWIEIWNSQTVPVNLAGYYLTDDPAIPNKWAFPSKTLSANGYLVVFASAKNRRDPLANLHTNFKLSSLGTYLALTKDNGAGGFTVQTEFSPTYPIQKEDVSYGSSDTEGYLGFMETPTPGQPNGLTVGGFVKDTNFSQSRGRFTAPFNLAITSNTTDATIRYTTDGSLPTINSGKVYTGPITINQTTVVRAAAFKPGWKPTNVDTQTYVFVDDVVNQTANTAVALGFPAGSVNGQVFRYGLNLAAVTSGGGTLQSLKNALAAAPTVCMTTDVKNLVDASTGIYVNPGQHGLFWERPVSIEYINTAGTSEFQIDCGTRIRGGASRTATNAKHAFHLFFRGAYDGDLKYRLFGTNGASSFSQIDIRSEQNYSWSKDNSSQNTMIREEWSRQTQGDMGQPWSRVGYFHLYINGIYWGVFNWEERTEAAYGETYLGGLKENIDTVKSAGSSGGYNTEMTDGNFAAWRSLFDQAIAVKNDGTETGRTAKYMKLRGLNPDGTRNTAFPVLLDVDNLIDYLLVIFYDGSFDAPMSTFLTNASNNWFGVRDRLGQRGFAYFAHDNEHGMDSTGTNSYNRVGPWGDPNATGNNWNQTWTTAQYRTRETFTKFNPQYLHELLAFSAEYRQRFADRVQKHCFNNGALTSVKATARVNYLAGFVDPIIHAEAARWGSTALTRNTWVSAKNTVLNYINTGGAQPTTGETLWPAQSRTTLMVEQLRGYTDNGSKPLFPPTSLLAPTVTGNFGGPVPNPYNLTLANPNVAGTVYYTLNGTDPRAISGAVDASAVTGTNSNPLTLTSTTVLRARVFNSGTGQWSALIEPQYLVGALATSSNLVISKIHYNPPGPDDAGEFVELMNVGAQAIDLTGVKFTLGIQFSFPDRFTLAPGARTLVVRTKSTFSNPDVTAMIAGEFENGTSLDNSGERLQLVDSAGAVIKDFSYSDSSPWPVSPDGDGPCLVLIKPETNPDPSVGTNWRASATVGGSPGVSDSLSYSAWATANNVTDATGNADGDGDGLSSLMEYFLGLNPNAPSLFTPVIQVQPLLVNGVVDNYLTITLKRLLGRDDGVLSAEGSSNLTGSWSAAVQVGNPLYNGDGTETLTFRHAQPVSAGGQQFLRAKVSKP